MLDRFERPVKMICLVLAAVLVWQLGSLVLSRDPLAHLKIPPLPALPGATNEPAKTDQKETNASVVAKTGTNGTNAAIGTNVVKGTNVVGGSNVLAKSTNAPAAGEAGQTSRTSPTGPTGPTNTPPRKVGMAGLPPGMPGGRRGGGLKKMELPPEVQSRVERIIESEIFGAIPRPMPMALLGIAEQEAFIQATNGQTEQIKVGGESGGIKLLRIGINRVLVEQDGEKKELTLFNGIGGESIMPKETNEPSTNAASTNVSSTDAPTNKASMRKAAAHNAATNQTLSSKQKEIQ